MGRPSLKALVLTAVLVAAVACGSSGDETTETSAARNGNSQPTTTESSGPLDVSAVVLGLKSGANDEKCNQLGCGDRARWYRALIARVAGGGL